MNTTPLNRNQLAKQPKAVAVKPPVAKKTTQRVRKPTTSELLIKLREFEWNFAVMNEIHE